MTHTLRAPQRRRSYIPAHTLHKATWQGVVRLGGRDFYTGRWGTERSVERYAALVRSYIDSGRTAVTIPKTHS